GSDEGKLAPVTSLLVALAAILAGGVAAVLLSPWPRLSSTFGALGVVLGAMVGAQDAVLVLRGEGGGALVLGWDVPNGALRIATDPLSAFFLVPIFVLSALAAVYGRAYLMALAGKKSLGVFWLAFNVLVASMCIVVVARHAVLFLVA